MRAFVVAIVIALQLHAYADPNEDAALVHLDRGIAAFNAKDFHRAHTEFTAAHDLAPEKANPYRWLALTEIQLGDCPSALPNIEGFLARVPATDARVAELTRWREFCQRSKPAPAPAVAPAPPPRQSLHERWWFWPVVGTAAVAVTGAIIYTATDSTPSTLPPIHCDTSGCTR
ncbi:MAG TPA: hypothetical protein VIV40_38605 [Kofleriaceae bacterium]